MSRLPIAACLTDLEFSVVNLNAGTSDWGLVSTHLISSLGNKAKLQRVQAGVAKRRTELVHLMTEGMACIGLTFHYVTLASSWVRVVL